jgi:hypothetical protein
MDTFNNNGRICSECTIDDCKICYYDLGGGATTFDEDFTPTADGTLKCGIC